MLRLTDIQLPFEHSETDLREAILQRLAIPASELISYAIFKRSSDARKKSAISFIYTLDIVLAQ